MTTRDGILPNNATVLERALEQTTARIADVPVPLSELWDPATCPLDLLPWLAWALSTDRWETDWTEGQKRAAVANAIELQRKKGTPASVDSILASFDELLTMTEWFEMRPPGTPHTFDINLPLISANGDFGGERSSAAFAEAIIRDVGRTKPARSHFRLLQTLEGAATIDVIGAGRVAGYRRGDFAADVTVEPVWDTYITTAIGEPIELPGGGFLEYAAPYAVTGADYAIALNFKAGQYWEGGTLAASLAALPGYAFTRTGARFELAASGHATVAFASGVPAIVPGVGFLSRTGWENGLLYSRDLTNAAWNKRGMAAVVTDGTLRSDGTGLASKVTVGAQTTGDVYQGAYSFGSTAGSFKNLLIKKVTAAGVLVIQSPWDASGVWQVDFSLLGTDWERLTPRHPAVTAAAPGKSGMHFYSQGGDTAPLTFYVDFCQCLSIDVANPPLIETAGSAASVGADVLAVSDAPTDVDQLFIVHAKPDPVNTGNPRLAYWVGGDFSGNDSIDVVAFPDGSGGFNLCCIINSGGANTHFAQAPFTPGAQLTIVVRRLAGAWRMGFVQNSGALTWTAEGPATTFPALTKVKPGIYAPASICQPEGSIALIARRLGAFASDAEVRTAALELS